jgi:hypothetical protein
MIIIYIIVILILIYLVYKRKIENEDTFANVQLTKTEYNNILNENIKKKFTMTKQGIRSFADLCKYFHPDTNNFILPTDTIINAKVDTQDILVNGDCILEGLTDINNLTVKGSVYIKNKDKSGDMFSYLDILPRGSIIPWTRSEIPNGWIIADGDYKFLENDINLMTPELSRGYYIAGATSNTANSIGGSDYININLPEHDHDINIGFSEFCYSNVDTDSPCINRGFRLISSERTFIGNDNKIYTSELSGSSGQGEPLKLHYPTMYVTYIMKI